MKMNQKTTACINSLNGEQREVVICEKTGDNAYLAEYDGKLCTAIFNVFVGRYYVDDVYGVIGETKE